jgi:tripartite-type tricarboxylate transporter receptor subunit TctC
MTMEDSTRRSVLAGVAAALALPAAGRAQHTAPGGFPDRPVRIVQGFSAGGPTDLVARVLAERLQPAWGVPVVAEARPGANGTIAAAHVARAAPDGQTLLVAASVHVQAPLLMPRLSYDALRDFTPIAQIAYYPFVLVVQLEQVPARTLAEFLAHARAHPGRVTNATTGTGSSPHLAAAMLGAATGVEFTHVPFSGTAQGLTALLAGQVAASFLNPFLALQPVQTGRLRALAVTSRERWRDLPEVPTLAESGHPGYEAISWFGVVGPAGLPAPLVARLHADIAAAARAPELRARLAAAGFDMLEAGPKAFRATMEADAAKWAEVIRSLGIRPE